MTEHVEKWHGISIWWPRPPRSLNGALYRLGEMGQAIFWMKSDISYGEMAREELRQQIRHLENLLQARWEANDARFSPAECPCGQKVCTVGALKTRYFRFPKHTELRRENEYRNGRASPTDRGQAAQ